MGRNKSVTISFLTAGHTKFSPDSCFGLVKRRFRRTIVGSIYDIVDVVEKSSTINKAQLIGTPQGEVLVPTYDWTGHLAPYFRRIKSLKTYHHFTLDSQCPGMVLLKETSDSPVTKERHLRDDNDIPSELPPTVTPSGLSNEKQWYLYDKIREFCPEGSRDLTCPVPTGPRPASSSRNTPDVDSALDIPSPATEVTKQRLCSGCGNPGHNIRSSKTRYYFCQLSLFFCQYHTHHWLFIHNPHFTYLFMNCIKYLHKEKTKLLLQVHSLFSLFMSNTLVNLFHATIFVTQKLLLGVTQATTNSYGVA